MEEDGRLEVLPIAEAVGHLLDRLNLRIQALCSCIRNPRRREVVEYSVEVALDHVGHVDDRLETRVRRPEEPLLVELGRPAESVVAPEHRERLFDGPGAGRLQFALA